MTNMSHEAPGSNTTFSRHMGRVFVSIALALAPSMLLAQVECDACSQSEVRQSVEMAIRMPPAAVPSGEGTSLRYELHVTNFSGKPQSLDALDVLDADSGHVLHRLGREQLRASIGPSFHAAAAADPLVIAAGRRVLVYLDLDLPGAPPDVLKHRLQLVSGTGEAEDSHWVEAAVVAVDKTPLPVLGPLLRGGPWIAIHGPTIERGHRRMVYALNGSARIPGRHAIDWILASPTPGRPAGLGAGADVLAVANALVVASHDGVPEPKPGSDPSRIPLADAPGNYIALDLGHGRFAVYEHLSPGLLVKPGDRVRRGQAIARVGTTGHATSPHLHFHVGNSADPLASEGLPFLMEGARVLGRYDSLPAAASGGSWIDSTATQRHDAPFFPDTQAVLQFP